MRVFVTGASGFIGSATVRELLDSGHEVTGLARSDRSAAAVAAAGAQVHRGDLTDLDSLRSGAAAADGVIHTAFIHDFTDFAVATETDRRAIEAMGEVLVGSDRPLVVASGTGGQGLDRPVTEQDMPGRELPRVSEATAMRFAERGVRVSVVRLPPTVHGKGDKGFIARLIGIARDKGVSGYPGDGTNRWPAVHRLDAAHLFRLALENAPAGTRVHGVDDEGVPSREIATIIGRHLDLPVTSIPADQVADHFGFLGPIFSWDLPASSEWTQKRMDWQPTHQGLVADMEEGHYFTGS